MGTDELIPVRRSAGATAVTEVLAPAHLVIAITIASGLAVPTDLLGRLGWAAAASLFTGIIPYTVGLRAIAKGSLSSRHLPNRAERVRPMAWTVVSVLFGWGLLIGLDAPVQVLAVQAAMLSGAVTALLITTVWKISLHCGVASAATMCAGWLFGPAVVLACLPLVVATGWSRLVLRDHTTAQVWAGTIVGALSAWPLLVIG